MASIINAALSGGLTTSADTSGILQLQTASTTAVTVDASQNVGIKTSSPAYPLHVSNYMGLGTQASSGSGAGINMIPSSTLTNWFIGANYTIAGAIELTPSTAGGGSTFTTPAFLITSTGNVGIGTSSPAKKLEIASSDISEGIRLYSTNAGGEGLSLEWRSGYGPKITADIESDASGEGGNFTIRVADTASTLQSRLHIDNAGNVSIGQNFDGGYGKNISLNADDSGQTTRLQWKYTGTASAWIERLHANGAMAFGVQSSERMRINGDGELLVAGTTDQGAYNIQCNGTGVWGAGAYVNGSDARIKEDITPISSSLDVVKKLNPVTYRYKQHWSKDQNIQTGFIAQELLEILKDENYVDGVVQQNSKYMSVAYQNIIPILTKAIQEQQALITTLTERITALEGA